MDSDNFLESDEDHVFSGSDSDDDMSMDDEGTVPCEEGFETEVLTPADLIETQVKSIKEINEIFQIPPQTARNLLHHFHWDKERLLERYYGGDIDMLYEEAQCVNPIEQTDNEDLASKMTPSSEICNICLGENEQSSFTTSSCCGASYCKDCWEEYISTQVVDEGKAYIACPSTECDKLIDELTVTKLISNAVVLSKYQSAIARIFVMGSKRIKFCSAADCENAIRVNHPMAKPVTCTCGHTFCFACGNPPHDPVCCAMLNKWIKKCEDDSETSNWIAANTKECPKCKATIEKNGGCNHMQCTNASCKLVQLQ